MGIVEGERGGGGDGHLFWIMLGGGLNSSTDPGICRDSSCWWLVLWEEVRLLVGLSGGGGGIDSMPLIWGMHGVTSTQLTT